MASSRLDYQSPSRPSWSFQNLNLDLDTTPSSSTRTTSSDFQMDRLGSRSGLLGSLKSRLSKSPGRESGAQDNPLANAPPTRRPDRPGMNAFTVPSNEPPPAYTAEAPAASPVAPQPYSPADIGQRAFNAGPPPASPARGASSSAAITTSTVEDKYAFLGSFDTKILIDDSGSMAGRSWRETSHALEAIAPICTAHDADGIDIFFLNAPDSPHFRNVTEASTIHEIFSTVKPQGGTMTGMVLNRILKEYMAAFEADRAGTKPLNLIVITDGDPADDVESVIIQVAQRLDRLDAVPWQVGIQMFQVGEEQGAREYLEMLDDELAQMGQGCRDIVDTVPFKPGHRGRGAALTADDILKVVLGAVNKRLDRRTNARTVT